MLEFFNPKKMANSAKKTQRITKACDYCHLKRIKCIKGTGDSCINCEAREINCTYLKPSSKRGPIPGSRKTKRIERPNSAATMTDSQDFSCSNALNDQSGSSMQESNELSKKYLKYQSLTIDSFPDIEIGPGKSLPWLQVYLLYVHPKYPLLPVDWIESNWKSIPLFLIHTMYVLTCADPLEGEHEGRSSVSDHFDYCNQLFGESTSKMTAIEVFGVFLMGAYCMNFEGAVEEAIEWNNEAIRLGHLFGIYNFAPIIWNQPDGTACAMSPDHSKRFCQLFSFLTFDADFHLSFHCKYPFYLYTSQSAQLFQPIFGGPSCNYNSYYSTYLWCWHSQLVYIARRVTSSVYGLQKLEMKDPLDVHISALNSWFKSIPAWVKRSDEVYSFDISNESPPPWIAAYLMSFYNYLKLILFKELFLQSIGDPLHSIVLDCLETAEEIDKITLAFLGGNPLFVGVPHYFAEFAFMAGAYFCFVPKSSSKDLSPRIDRSIKVLGFYSKYNPALREKIALLVAWKSNSTIDEAFTFL